MQAATFSHLTDMIIVLVCSLIVGFVVGWWAGRLYRKFRDGRADEFLTEANVAHLYHHGHAGEAGEDPQYPSARRTVSFATTDDDGNEIPVEMHDGYGIIRHDDES